MGFSKSRVFPVKQLRSEAPRGREQVSVCLRSETEGGGKKSLWRSHKGSFGTSRGTTNTFMAAIWVLVDEKRAHSGGKRPGFGADCGQSLTISLSTSALETAILPVLSLQSCPMSNTRTNLFLFRHLSPMLQRDPLSALHLPLLGLLCSRPALGKDGRRRRRWA
jgi:hypothetical protein